MECAREGGPPGGGWPRLPALELVPVAVAPGQQQPLVARGRLPGRPGDSASATN
jgi:hypothetical protein